MNTITNYRSDEEFNCQRAGQLIHGYIDSELGPLATLEVEKHIEQCEGCRLDYRSQIKLRSSLKDTSFYYQAPANLKRRISLSFPKEVRAQTTKLSFKWGWAIAAASLVLLFVVGAVWSVVPRFIRSATEDQPLQEIVANHIRSLQTTNHLTYVLSSDQHTVKPWFNGKADFSPPVRDFAEQDFRLYGGRLEYLNNRKVATLIYRHRLHYINLFIWPTEQA